MSLGLECVRDLDDKFDLEALQRNLDRIDGVFPIEAGAGTLQKSPQARVYNNAAISVADATPTALTFNTERYDFGPAEQHSTSTNTGRLTCVRSGLYAAGVVLNFGANATGSRVVAIRLNGSTPIAEDGKPALAGGYGTAFAISTDYRLSTGDYLDVTVFQNSGGALNVLAEGNKSPEFYWHWVSP